MRVYIVTNEKYCPEPVDTTLDQLEEYCRDMGWQVELKESYTTNGYVVIDHNREIVAEENPKIAIS